MDMKIDPREQVTGFHELPIEHMRIIKMLINTYTLANKYYYSWRRSMTDVNFTIKIKLIRS